MAALFTVSLFKDSDEKGRLGRFRLHGEMKWPEKLTRHLQEQVRSLGEIRSTLDITAPQDTSSDELYGFIAKFRNNWRQGNTPTHLEAGRLRADFKLDPWSKEAGHEALNELSDSLKMLMMCWMAMPGMAATKLKE